MLRAYVHSHIRQVLCKHKLIRYQAMGTRAKIIIIIDNH